MSDSDPFVGNRVDKASLRGFERRMHERLMRRVLACVATVQVDTVLDVGCGEGLPLRRMAQRFSDRTFVGVDLDEHPDWQQIRSHRVRFRTGSALALPFSDGEFQLVTAIEVLEHLDEPDKAMREIRRVCPNGWLIASVPWEIPWRLGNITKGRYITSAGNTPEHVTHWWTPGSFRRFLRSHGEVTELRRPLPWTLAVVRLKPVQ